MAESGKPDRPRSLGLHLFELTSPCHQIVLALDQTRLNRGDKIQIQASLLEDVSLLEGVTVIKIRVSPSPGNSL